MNIDSASALILSAIIKATAPKLVYECGAWPGTSTRVILDSLRQGSKLISSEPNEEWRMKLIQEYAAIPSVRFVPDIENFSAAKFTFIDSGADLRWIHMGLWTSTASPGTLCLLHDTRADADPYPRAARSIEFDLPRGLRLTQHR